MQHRAQGIDVSLINDSIAQHDPVRFVLSEDMVIFATKARVPQLKPSTVLFPDRWKKYKRRKDQLDAMEEWLDEQWMLLVQGIITAQITTVLWHAGEAQRNLEWAEQLRRDAEQFRQHLGFEDARLDVHKKQLALEDAVAATRDGRMQSHQIAVMKLQHIYAKEMEALKFDQTDPAYKAGRYKAAMELLKPELDAIAASNHTTAVKNQLSRAYLDALKLILQ